MRLPGLILLFSACALAGEFAVFPTGSRLHIDRHEVLGAKVRLYNADGYIEIESAQVHFEPDNAVAPPPAAPQASPATTAATLTPAEMADAAADKYGLPRKLVRSVMEAESDFEPQAVSPKGAIGLMQLMPATAEMLGVDPKDPVQNVDAGARYLRDLLEKYDGGLRHALAAYNAGPAAVDKYAGVPPYAETIHYVTKIEKEFEKGN